MNDLEYARRDSVGVDWKPGLMARRLIAIDDEFRSLDVARTQAIVMAGGEERRSRIAMIDAEGRALLAEKDRLEKFLAKLEGRR